MKLALMDLGTLFGEGQEVGEKPPQVLQACLNFHVSWWLLFGEDPPPTPSPDLPPPPSGIMEPLPFLQGLSELVSGPEG